MHKGDRGGAMSKIFEKLDKLGRVHDSTPFEEEKKTCAVVAAKILTKNGIKLKEYKAWLEGTKQAK